MSIEVRSALLTSLLIVATSGSLTLFAAEPNEIAALERQLRVDFKSSRAAQDRLWSLQKEGGEVGKRAENVVKRFRDEAAEWVAKCGGEPTGIFAYAGMPPEEMTYLYGFRHSGLFGITGKDVTDKHLMYLDGFDRLELLDIADAKVTGEFLKHLSLKKLKILHLSGCPVEEKYILDHLSGLTVLGVNNTPVTDALIRKLSKDSLRSLHIANTNVSDALLRELSSFKKLDFLRLDLQQTKALPIDAVKSIPSLRWLYISCKPEELDEANRVRDNIASATGLKVRVDRPYKKKEEAAITRTVERKLRFYSPAAHGGILFGGR